VIDPVQCLLRSRAFAELAPAEQADARAIVLGPVLNASASKTRRASFARRWELRRREMTAELDRGPDRLRELIYAPSRAIHFLDATSVNGHAALVLGDPAERSALCYGRRWVRARQRRIKFVLMSPDSTIASGWDRPPSDRAVKYAAKRIVISRIEEHALVQWSEDNFAFVHPNEIKSSLPGPLPAPVRGATFTDDALLLLLRLASWRPRLALENLVLLGGRA
jgi:hypothetical protein